LKEHSVHDQQTTTPPEGKPVGARARRAAAAALRTISRMTDTVGLIAASGILAVDISSDVFHYGPQMGFWTVVLYVAAIYGTTEFLREAAFRAAREVNPDTRDGDRLHEAAAIVRKLREETVDGVDVDSVLEQLREAKPGTALGDLAADLAPIYESKGNYQTAAGLYLAAQNLRAADEDIAYGRG
jgi:hypothetical protein